MRAARASSAVLKLSILVTSALLAGLAQAAPSDHDTYRCVVGGERQACETRTRDDRPAPGTEQPALGSYARYLVLNGESRERASIRSLAIGETPVTTEQAQAALQLTSRQRYDRAMGQPLNFLR